MRLKCCILLQNLENSSVATGLKKLRFHSNFKGGQCKERSIYCSTALISHASKVMLKILQARLWQSVNHAKMGLIKNRNGMDLTEAQDIKKRWQKYTEEFYKKDLHDPDNHDGVITDLEPEILECEVKWALGSNTMNKASGGDGIPMELFQILKDDAVKVLHSIYQQICKTQQWPQDWKGQFSFQSQRKAMPKNAQTTAQLHSSYMLVK